MDNIMVRIVDINYLHSTTFRWPVVIYVGGGGCYL